MLYVGNDIVDLNEEHGSLKHQDHRFLTRVFTPQEKAFIQNSSRPEISLWMLWAAKEASFKIVSKLDASTVFAHQLFQVTLTESRNIASVSYKRYRINVSFIIEKDFIHAVANWVEKKDSCNHSQLFSSQHYLEKEQLEEKKSESKWVRHYLKAQLSKSLNINADQIEIRRESREGKPAPVEVYLNECKRADVDISLSHHGSWVAWAYSVKP